MKQSAAIKRATQRARNEMRALDASAIEQLTQIYQAAAEEVRREIHAAAAGGNAVPDYALRQLLERIDHALERLAEQRDALLHDKIEEAAALGTQPFTPHGVAAVGGTEAVVDSSASPRISQAAVEFVLNHQQADGLNLSERVWRLNQGAKEVLHRAIASAVLRGNSAARAAQQLIAQGGQLPAQVRTQVKDAQPGEVARAADLLTDSDGGEVWKAERVLRTEINRAHGEAFMATAERTPGFAGFRFLLSPAHPQPDICDLLAAQNIHGLGAGVYPTRELTPWPAHPNTISFLEIVFANEISDADRAGKETELQALQRLAPEIRAGVLGATKAKYFDRGLLTRGMIRANLSSVEARLDRQGKL